jgi:hypothetical protein
VRTGVCKARPPAARFWEKVRVGAGCWEWLASVNLQGYGLFNRATRPTVCVLAHRFAYEVCVEAIPAGLCVLHRCDNPRCVNPAHLFVGTRTDNAADKVAKNRQARPKGVAHPRHKLTEEDVRTIRRLFAVGGINKSALARRFSVNHTTIRGIISRALWPHVTEDTYA